MAKSAKSGKPKRRKKKLVKEKRSSRRSTIDNSVATPLPGSTKKTDGAQPASRTGKSGTRRLPDKESAPMVDRDAEAAAIVDLMRSHSEKIARCERQSRDADYAAMQDAAKSATRLCRSPRMWQAFIEPEHWAGFKGGRPKRKHFRRALYYLIRLIAGPEPREKDWMHRRRKGLEALAELNVPDEKVAKWLKRHGGYGGAITAAAKARDVESEVAGRCAAPSKVKRADVPPRRQTTTAAKASAIRSSRIISPAERGEITMTVDLRYRGQTTDILGIGNEDRMLVYKVVETGARPVIWVLSSGPVVDTKPGG